ncbi:hypothetical protein [Streptomyces acidiscabies]|uniref:hypothetical protein n=1 Tax=Streptomyces acidiscabies TaxID=42234 RepID=UPI0038F60FC6
MSEVEAHVRAFFAGHAVEATNADVRVLTVSPGPRIDSWSYVTVGCSDEEHAGLRREFVMVGHVRDERSVDLVTMLAAYHRTGHPRGDRVPPHTRHGALEQLFDDHALLPTDPHRKPVV